MSGTNEIHFEDTVLKWKGRSKSEAGAVEKCDTWVINILVWGLLSSR